MDKSLMKTSSRENEREESGKTEHSSFISPLLNREQRNFNYFFLIISLLYDFATSPNSVSLFTFKYQ